MINIKHHMIKRMDWFLALMALFVIYFIANNTEEILTEQIYLLNTYLYILLAIIIVVTSWNILDDNPTFVEHMYSSWNCIGLIILSFAALFFTVLIPTENVVAKHAAWTLFVTTIGMLLYVSYLQSKSSGNLMHVGIILIILVAILTWTAYVKPIDYFDSYGKPLLMMLLGLIIIELGDMIFFGGTDAFFTRFRVYSWVAIVIFSGLLLYDTQKIREHAIIFTTECAGKRQLECVDYCTESLTIFLDIANLFSSINNVSN